MWTVDFGESQTVIVPADDAEAASLLARMQAWLVTGKWLEVKAVTKEA